MFGGKFFVLGGHLQILVHVTDRLDQETFFQVARHDGRSGIAAFEQGFACVEQQTTLDLFALRAVAFVAVVNEQRANFLFEKINPVGVRRRGSPAAGQRHAKRRTN